MLCVSPFHQRASAQNDSLISDLPDFRLSGPLLTTECGITLAPVYYGEVFSNTRGGISTKGATQYEGLLNLPVELDCQRLGLPLPGRFSLLAQNTHGRGLSQDFIGDFQTISNIDSFSNIMQVSEYWWEVTLPDGNVMVRLGKQDVNTEFLVIDTAQDFIQSSFGLSPNAGLPSYPNPSMAAVMLADLTPSVRLKAGVWDLLADGGSWGFSDNDLTLAIAQLQYKYTLLDNSLPGALNAGLAYTSGGDAIGLTFPSAFGYYLQFEQLIYQEDACDNNDLQGLGVFVGYFPRDPSGPIPIPAVLNNVLGGAVYKGLLPGRNQDVVGAGVTWAKLNQGGTNQETAIEVFYKAQLSSSVSIQPDMQYVVSPSGLYRDALAVGVRFQLDL